MSDFDKIKKKGNLLPNKKRSNNFCIKAKLVKKNADYKTLKNVKRKNFSEIIC